MFMYTNSGQNKLKVIEKEKKNLLQFIRKKFILWQGNSHTLAATTKLFFKK